MCVTSWVSFPLRSLMFSEDGIEMILFLQVQRRQGTRPDSQLPQVQWKKHPETSLMGLICVLPINALTSYGTQFGIRNFKDEIKVTPSFHKEGDLREVHTEKMSYEDVFYL